MTQQRQVGPLAGPGVMLLSAAIFGYFGYSVTWLTTSNNGVFLVYVAILEWTLKLSAIAFLTAAVITFVSPIMGNLAYSVIGMLGALAFVVVLVLDLQDPQHQAMAPILLVIFAVWNGYGAWTGLRQALAARSEAAGASVVDHSAPRMDDR